MRSGHTEADRDRIMRSMELLEKTGQLSKVKDSEMSEKEAEERKAEIRAWMAEKQHERLEDYRRKVSELREHEHNPFRAERTDTSFKVN